MHIPRVAVLAVLSLALFSCGGNSTKYSEGDDAPEFSLKDVSGKKVSLSDFSGKVVVLSLFATWCGPCNMEMPELQRLHREMGDKGVVVLGLNQGEDAETVKNYVEQKGLTFPVLLDESMEMGERIDGMGIPRLVLIDAERKIRRIQIGYSPQSFREAEREAQSLSGK